jgi:hypothetical protein
MSAVERLTRRVNDIKPLGLGAGYVTISVGDAREILAIAMEAREGRDGETRLDAKHDSAGRKASPKPSPTGDQR